MLLRPHTLVSIAATALLVTTAAARCASLQQLNVDSVVMGGSTTEDCVATTFVVHALWSSFSPLALLHQWAVHIALHSGLMGASASGSVRWTVVQLTNACRRRVPNRAARAGLILSTTCERGSCSRTIQLAQRERLRRWGAARKRRQ